MFWTTALVTKSEMLEHGFYQLLNLAQIRPYAQSTYPRSPRNILPVDGHGARLVALRHPRLPDGAGCTAAFPVNSFSANYTGDSDPWLFINVMYRIKIPVCFTKMLLMA